jgi:hypothetical protein
MIVLYLAENRNKCAGNALDSANIGQAFGPLAQPGSIWFSLSHPKSKLKKKRQAKVRLLKRNA